MDSKRVQVRVRVQGRGVKPVQVRMLVRMQGQMLDRMQGRMEPAHPPPHPHPHPHLPLLLYPPQLSHPPPVP